VEVSFLKLLEKVQKGNGLVVNTHTIPKHQAKFKDTVKQVLKEGIKAWLKLVLMKIYGKAWKFFHTL